MQNVVARSSVEAEYLTMTTTY